MGKGNNYNNDVSTDDLDDLFTGGEEVYTQGLPDVDGIESSDDDESPALDTANSVVDASSQKASKSSTTVDLDINKFYRRLDRFESMINDIVVDCNDIKREVARVTSKSSNIRNNFIVECGRRGDKQVARDLLDTITESSAKFHDVNSSAKSIQKTALRMQDLLSDIKDLLSDLKKTDNITKVGGE